MKLTELARKTLEGRFNGKDYEPDEKTKKEYSRKAASFVTLTLNGELRGCIGSMEARRELWKDVAANSISAAFQDPRFYPLQETELKRVKIEVSILTEPRKLEYQNEKDLLEKINCEMGIILQNNGSSATFLPQVWEQVPDKTEFLEHLSRKAGLSRDAWKTAEIWYYHVEKEKENEN